MSTQDWAAYLGEPAHFAQSTFADGWLFTANIAGLAAWGP